MPVTSELGVLLGCSVSGLHAKWQAGAEVNAKPLAGHNNGARARAAYLFFVEPLDDLSMHLASSADPASIYCPKAVTFPADPM